MVRRGSTVRVRQRALESPQNGDFCCLDWYNRAPPLQGGGQSNALTRSAAERAEQAVGEASTSGANARVVSGDRSWGRFFSSSSLVTAETGNAYSLLTT